MRILSRKDNNMENGYPKVIEIVVSKPISADLYQYIADCWADFVACDLGYKPRDFLMISPDIL